MPLQVSDYSRGYRYRYEYERYVEIGGAVSSGVEALHGDTLVRAIGPELAQQFHWVAETGTIQTYEHRSTSRYVHIDGVTGQFCDQDRNPTSVELALARAMELPQALRLPRLPGAVSTDQELEIGVFVRRRNWSGVASAMVSDAEPVGRVSQAQRCRRVLSNVLHHFATKLRTPGMQDSVGSGPAMLDNNVALPESEPAGFELREFTRGG